jgi:hypothetical protein
VPKATTHKDSAVLTQTPKPALLKPTRLSSLATASARNARIDRQIYLIKKSGPQIRHQIASKLEASEFRERTQCHTN